ncbi:MAG: acetyl-CoA carboxylase biotin carboxyl carrier protein [Candidatus Acidiferrales bacterium]
MAKKSKAEAGAGTESPSVNLGEIERLLTFMQSHGLEELEYQRGDLHVRLRKASAFSGPVVRAGVAEHDAGLTERHLSAPPASSSAARADARAEAENVHTIKSPIVGTFYSAPSPEAEPFVTMGARVETGQVLCIIEAMKLMNEIESDVAGEVVRLHVENGKPVEYGAPLYDIRIQSPGKK